VSRWRYFTDDEVKGLNPDLVYKLDRMRSFLGIPIRLTETVAKGGSHVKNSAHETGHAADFTIRKKSDPSNYTLQEQLLIAWAAGRAGFSRIGVYNRHCHVDVDSGKPSPAIWTGESK
jgi:hypothetical protein